MLMISIIFWRAYSMRAIVISRRSCSRAVHNARLSRPPCLQDRDACDINHILASLQHEGHCDITPQLYQSYAQCKQCTRSEGQAHAETWDCTAEPV